MLLLLVGCRNLPPCQDCDDAAAEDDASMPDLPTPPDLPCGGADLLTDDLNCGTCGHACEVWYVDTVLETGGCVDGVCGPLWSHCFSEASNVANCSDVCAAYELSCVPNGCAGHTGAMYEPAGLDDICGPITSGPPDLVLDGACDDPIPWMSMVENPREVMCCCDFQ